MIEASNYDMIILSAGASKGERDFVEEAIKSFGKLIIHGISIKPVSYTHLWVLFQLNFII